MAAMKSGAWRSVVIAAWLSILPTLAKAYFITVDNVECVSEYVPHDGDLVSGNFVVVDKHVDWYADKDDIEMVVTGPSGDKVVDIKSRGGQKFLFRAPKLGQYKICFFNPTPAPEKVSFAIHVGRIAESKDVAKDEHFSPLDSMIVRLQEAVEKLSLEQQYYKARDVRHRLTNESTHNRLLWYTLTEYVALITCSVAQVYLVQRLFSKRIGYNRV